ncbi:MAG: hypothetical protein ACLQPD_10435, partial [Desulfomonilaceae bacterium]
PNSLEAPPLEEGELRPEVSPKPMFHSNSLTTATKKPLALHCWNAPNPLDNKAPGLLDKCVCSKSKMPAGISHV